jgi:hypothetical protein
MSDDDPNGRVAKALIDAHEKECVRTHERIDANILRVHERVDQLPTVYRCQTHEGTIGEVATRLDGHLTDHLSKEELKDMRRGIEWVKSRIWLGLGALALLQFLGGLAILREISRMAMAAVR